MKSEKEIKELLAIFKDVEVIIHPSLKIFAEWVLEIGDEKEKKFWIEMMHGIAEAHRSRENAN